MGLPRETWAQRERNADGVVEVYIRGLDTGVVLRRREYERVMEAKARKLEAQEFAGILGSTVVLDGADILLVFYQTAETCRAIWEDELETARHEMTSGG